MLVVWLEGFVYWNGSLWLKGSHTVRDLLLKVYVPFFSLYSVSAICFMPFYFLMDVHYCRLKQKDNLQKISINVHHLTKLMSSFKKLVPGNNFAKKCSAVKSTFARGCRMALILFKECSVLDRYWRPLMSVEFVGYISMICYLFHGFFTDTNAFELGQRSFFVFFAIELFIFLIIITLECSTVVSGNVKYYNLNKKYVVEMNRNKELITGVGIHERLKVSAIYCIT